MVAHKHIALWMLAMGIATGMAAQNFDVNDTTTEYPMKGTFYHNKFEGRKTASGEIFNQNLFTAAHWKIKKGTHVLVTNVNTGLQVIVKVNDRCPKKGVIDMTRRAAHAIGIKGCQRVTLRILPEGYEEACLAQDAKFDSVPSRFASGEYSLSNSSTSSAKSSSTSTSKPVNGERITSTKPQKSATKSKEKRYNLQIGSARSIGEAFSMIQRLPDLYREKTIVDSITQNSYTLTLDVNLTAQKAQELSRALRHTFKDCKLIPTE